MYVQSIDPYSWIVSLSFLLLLASFLWLFFKSKVVRIRYRDAYYIARLKEHAKRKNLNIEEEFEKFNKLEFFKKKEKEERELNDLESDIAYTDFVFSEIERLDKKTKGGK